MARQDLQSVSALIYTVSFKMHRMLYRRKYGGYKNCWMNLLFTLEMQLWWPNGALLSADGLWADYNDGSWPSCCSGKNFDVKEVWFLVYSYDNNIDSRTYVYIHTLVYLCKLFVPYCPSIVHSVVSLNIMFESERNHYFFNGEVISSLSGLPRYIIIWYTRQFPRDSFVSQKYKHSTVWIICLVA